ncbi:histone-lysine N-methyltransferase SETMAR [Trichonephila clavipes]|nr:histone-lysine N-methyltransferase SETMAR [Trichonephila clavipes]
MTFHNKEVLMLFFFGLVRSVHESYHDSCGFWDRKGILLIDFLPCGETVSVDRYCEALWKLRRTIQNKRCGMLDAGVVLLHDNTRPHAARRTAAVLKEFGWELFDQPAYSSDLAPSKFFLFLHLKKFLSSGERFGNDEELKTFVTRWFHSRRQSSSTE